MPGLQPLDVAVCAILLVAALRGMSLGLIREAFSILALGAAVIAVRVWNPSFAAWLAAASLGAVPRWIAPWVAGALLAVGVIAAVGIFGRVMRQGARAAGLGWFDRLGGAAIGAAEGAIAAGALLLVIGGLLGRGHALVTSSRSFAVLQRAEQFTELRQPDVAAPPARR
jgi:membrane protein required for colicin V production